MKNKTETINAIVSLIIDVHQLLSNFSDECEVDVDFDAEEKLLASLQKELGDDLLNEIIDVLKLATDPDFYCSK